MDGCFRIISTSYNYIIGTKESYRRIRKNGLRENVKIIVGGAPVNEEWARKIGADSYAPDAVKAVDKIKEVLSLTINVRFSIIFFNRIFSFIFLNFI